MRERYGVRATPEEIKELNEKINKGQTKKIIQISHTRSYQEVIFKNKKIYCVYDHKNKLIKTVLSKDMYSVEAALNISKLIDNKTLKIEISKTEHEINNLKLNLVADMEYLSALKFNLRYFNEN